ncbi:MAG: hypothetical protein M3N47_04715 [Chloroflexota bacterium]|nr:hypothetical protein [Chloroflexota bacterium]
MSADQERLWRRAQQIIEHAWRDLPAYDRHLLQSIGASQWLITTEATGRAVDDLLRSAGYERLSERAVRDLNAAAGVWFPELRLVVISAPHEPLAELDDRTYEAMLARVAWHEWAHALSAALATVVRSTRMNSSLRSTLCSCRAGVAARPGSLRGFTTRSTTFAGG